MNGFAQCGMPDVIFIFLFTNMSYVNWFAKLKLVMLISPRFVLFVNQLQHWLFEY